MAAKTEKTFWNNPKFDREGSEVVGVDFRDGYVRLEKGLVMGYFDKDRQVMLVPNVDAKAGGKVNQWSVLDKDSNPTGALWRGTIEVVNNNVVLEQVHNGLKRTYIADGSIETEYRTSRVTETPGKRKIVYKDGTRIEENLQDQTSVTTYDDRVVSRLSDGRAKIKFINGTDVEVEVDQDGQIVLIRDRKGERRLTWKGGIVCEVIYV